MKYLCFLYRFGNYSLPCLWYPLESDLVIMSNELPSLPFVCIDHILDNDTFIALLATHPRLIALFKRTFKNNFCFLLIKMCKEHSKSRHFFISWNFLYHGEPQEAWVLFTHCYNHSFHSRAIRLVPRIHSEWCKTIFVR